MSICGKGTFCWLYISHTENVIPVQGTGVSDCLQFGTSIIVEVFKVACIVPRGTRMSFDFVTTLFIDR